VDLHSFGGSGGLIWGLGAFELFGAMVLVRWEIGAGLGMQMHYFSASFKVLENNTKKIHSFLGTWSDDP
jgi:hypothetical protein